MKKNIYYCFILLGVVGVIDTTWLLIFQSGMNTGTFFPSIVGMVLIYYSLMKIKGHKYVIKNKTVRNYAKISLTLFLVSFIIIQIFLHVLGNSQSNMNTDYLIILGTGLNGDKISLALKERLDKGIEFYIKNPNTKIVVSGGQGARELVTEAFAMKKYLEERSIPSESIITEDKSTSTMENFKFTKNILKNVYGKDKVSLMIITNDFHMMRSKMVAQRNGFIVYGISCRTPWQVYVNTYSREYFAFIKSYFFDK